MKFREAVRQGTARQPYRRMNRLGIRVKIESVTSGRIRAAVPAFVQMVHGAQRRKFIEQPLSFEKPLCDFFP